MKILNYKILRAGQARAYQDSVYSYEIEFDKVDPDGIWDLCQTLKKAFHRKDNHVHTGACGFPFGLASFGSLKKIEENKYIYTVTIPYCD